MLIVWSLFTFHSFPVQVESEYRNCESEMSVWRGSAPLFVEAKNIKNSVHWFSTQYGYNVLFEGVTLFQSRCTNTSYLQRRNTRTAAFVFTSSLKSRYVFSLLTWLFFLFPFSSSARCNIIVALLQVEVNHLVSWIYGNRNPLSLELERSHLYPRIWHTPDMGSWTRRFKLDFGFLESVRAAQFSLFVSLHSYFLLVAGLHCPSPNLSPHLMHTSCRDIYIVLP